VKVWGYENTGVRGYGVCGVGVGGFVFWVTLMMHGQEYFTFSISSYMA